MNDLRLEEVKTSFAELFTKLDALRTEAGRGEAGRRFSVAITELETSELWTEKAFKALD